MGVKKRGYALAALMLALGLALLWRVRGAVKIALWALLFADLADPPVTKAQPRLGRAGASLLVTVGALAAAALALGAVLIPALAQLSRLPMLAERAGQALSRLAQDGRFRWAGDVSGLIAQLGARLFSRLTAYGAALGTGLVHLAAVGALTVFFLLDWEHLTLRLSLMIPSRWRARAIGASRAVRRDLGAYLRGQLTVAAAVSLIAAAALFAARTPLPLAMGVMYGALNAVPYVGPLLAAIPPVLAALALGWKTAVMTLLILVLIQQIDNYVISPRVLGAASGMGPAAVLLSISLGSALAGVAGMFLALPCAVAARSVYRAFVGGAEERPRV